MNVQVQLGPRSYDIQIKAGLLDQLPKWLRDYNLAPAKGMLVTDDEVDRHHTYLLQQRLVEAGLSYPRSVVPAGEESKSQEWLFNIYEDALDARLDRKSVILAVGGGVVGDLGGYAAASFMRGIRYVQIPTTLLSMVDSAVGGKTGINLRRGKNLIGAFHQPSLVLCDLSTLKTLPPREFRSGLAEIIKYGIIYDRVLFEYLETGIDAALNLDMITLEHLVSRSCMIKAEVVSQDETESGLRAILNFGHTLGHAIEAVAGYGKYLHGEAIAIGMVYAARLSEKLLGLSGSEVTRIATLLERAKLPVKPRALPWAELRAAMALDKKTTDGKVKFVLARSIGQVDFGVEVDDALLKQTWETL
jgi:3-dehydroquinate synthase